MVCVGAIRKFNYSVDTQIYELPDRQRLEVMHELYDVPEMLFNPIVRSGGQGQ